MPSKPHPIVKAWFLAVAVFAVAVVSSRWATGEEPQRIELKYGTPTAVEHVKAGYVTGVHNGRSTLWVAWAVNAAKLKDPVPRKGFPFHPDTSVPIEFRVVPKDYNGCGDDRGHISPFADNAWSKESAADSMLMINMMPQRKKLNEGHTKWEGLEHWHREQVTAHEAQYISFAGPAFLPDEDGVVHFRAIGRHCCWEPSHCWRTSVIEYPDKLVLKTWLMPNVDEPPDFTECEVSCDSLEEQVGLDFWKSLDGAEELEAVE